MKSFTLKNRILVVFLVAFIVRLGVFIGARDIDYGFSAAFKLGNVAHNLLTGQGLVWEPAVIEALNAESIRVDPSRPQLDVFEKVKEVPEPHQMETYRGRPPGYSMILAATWKLFGHERFVYSQALFSLLDALSGIFIFLLAAEFFGATVAFIAGLIYAIGLPFAVLAILPGHDAIGTLPLTAGLYFIWRGLKNNSPLFLMGGGISIGLGTLVRQEPFFIPFLIAFPLLFVKEWKKALQVFIFAQMFVFLVNLPWIIRNRQMTGKGDVFSPAYGATLLAGIGAYPNRWGVEASDSWIYEFVKNKGSSAVAHSPEFNRICLDEFKRILKEDPLWYVSIVVRRGIKSMAPTLMPFEKGYTRYYLNERKNVSIMEFARSHPIEFIVPVFFKGLWALLWLFSVLILFDRRFSGGTTQRAFLLGLLLIVIYYVSSHMLMLTEARFLLPGFFPLIILGSAGLCRIRREV